MNHQEHPDSIDGIIKEVSAKDTHVLCREVMSITDTMDVLRAKWNVEILTAIICGQTRFKDILAVVKGISEKVLSDLGEMFSLADLVKFAKHVPTEQESEKAIPVAVNFVNFAYMQQLQQNESNLKEGK